MAVSSVVVGELNSPAPGYNFYVVAFVFPIHPCLYITKLTPPALYFIHFHIHHVPIKTIILFTFYKINSCNTEVGMICSGHCLNIVHSFYLPSNLRNKVLVFMCGFTAA